MDTATALQVFVSPFLGVVFDNLSSLIQKEIGLVLGVNKELDKLSITLSIIQAVLEDAEDKQIDDKPINIWLRKLKDLVYEADDILDECATEALIPENTQVTSRPSGSTCFNFKGIMFRRSIAKRIKKLLEKFDEMAELRIKYHLNSTPKHVESGRNDHRETSPNLSEPQVYGREEEKEHIANLLLNGGDEVSVCCILGLGGLGKTTLAQLVYNDENITNHFQLKCWVCVSDNFVLKKLLKSIIESTGGNARDIEDLGPLESRVQEILNGKKFLLVLDDVWNEDRDNWDKLKSSLAYGGIGSSIIVTTRLESVASLTSTHPIQHLESLSAENCWSLFQHYAFDAAKNEYQKFEEIGKEIVKKCGGVPLAAKTLGGSLRRKTENEWLSVRNSALWDLPQKKGDILPALRLSYNHLPLHSKQCFSFCSVFPKDYEIVKEDLIHLWMANGFLQSKGSMRLEDIGNTIFNELLGISFFQEAMKDKYGDIVNCKMHDLVHDLACSITMNECTTVEAFKDKNVYKSRTRHLVLDIGSYSSAYILNLWLSEPQPLLRTFFSVGWYEHHIQGLTFTSLKCLRVLDLSYTDITTLHVTIGKLKHLRYLDLSYCMSLRSLPDESICNLRNLQVLKLDHCRSLQALPESIRKMTNLRHLGIIGCDDLRRMPVGMGNLSCLRTLNMFVVVPETGRGISALQGLDHLTGELEIKGLEDVRSSKDAENANLGRKKNLRTLTLFWSEENNVSNFTVEEEEEKVGSIGEGLRRTLTLFWSKKNNVANCTVGEEEKVASIGEGLRPHPNIRVLELNYYNGLKFPSWMSHSGLPNLVEISLVGCRRCEHLPPLGRLAFLEILKISKMYSVKCIGDEFYNDHSPTRQGSSLFPSLRKLEIRYMPNWEEWSWSSSMPSLEELTLEGCLKLRTLPTTLSSALKKLELNNCNEMVFESSSSLVKVIGCLQSLKIKSFNKIKTLPKVLLENLPSTLTDLHIRNCKELVCLPEGVMQNLTSLSFFVIDYCPSLKVLPELGSRNNNTSHQLLRIEDCYGLTSVSDCLRHLTALEYLFINNSPELKFLPDDFQDLTSLRHLDIASLPQMTCLPEGLQQVAGTLDFLSISGCSGLTSLPEWMDKFTSLQYLYIKRCENLKVLPEEVLHLTSLKELTVEDCHPVLHRRYAKETGEDWHKIAHIPDLKIDVTTEWKTEHGIGGGMKCNMIPCFSSSSSGTN